MTRSDGGRFTEQLSLELRMLGAQVTCVAVKLIDGGIAVPLVGRIVRVIVCGRVRPAIRRLRDDLDHRSQCDGRSGILVDSF